MTEKTIGKLAVQSLGYVVIETTDLAKWDTFLQNVVGAMPGGTGADGAAHYVPQATKPLSVTLKAEVSLRLPVPRIPLAIDLKSFTVRHRPTQLLFLLRVLAAL